MKPQVGVDALNNLSPESAPTMGENFPTVGKSVIFKRKNHHVSLILVDINGRSHLRYQLLRESAANNAIGGYG